MRWPLQPLQPLQKAQLQPPFGPSVDSLCHPRVTTTNPSYRSPIFETSATALRGTTGISYNYQLGSKIKTVGHGTSMSLLQMMPHLKRSKCSQMKPKHFNWIQLIKTTSDFLVEASSIRRGFGWREEYLTNISNKQNGQTPRSSAQAVSWVHFPGIHRAPWIFPSNFESEKTA